MFTSASAFNHDISSWTGSAATTAQTDMFLDATAFQAKFTCDDAVTGPARSCNTIKNTWVAPPPPSFSASIASYLHQRNTDFPRFRRLDFVARVQSRRRRKQRARSRNCAAIAHGKLLAHMVERFKLDCETTSTQFASIAKHPSTIASFTFRPNWRIQSKQSCTERSSQTLRRTGIPERRNSRITQDKVLIL